MDTTKPISEEITKSSFAAMAGVMLSRASGVLRTIVVNATFGAVIQLDAFNAAFRLPNSLRDLFADGALSAAFMTSLAEAKQLGIEDERKLISIVLGFFGVITFSIALFGVFFSQQVIDLITDQNFKQMGGLPIAALLFQFLVFYLPLTMMNAVIMAILGVYGQAFRAMNGSIFLNVGMIGGALLFAPLLIKFGWLGIYGLAFGALIGALLQMLYQMLPLFSLNLIPLPTFNPRVWYQYQPLKKILVQMAPRVLGQGALVLALSINTFFATQIGVGVLTYIVTAVTIIQVPIGLFGVATGFAALPSLVGTLSKRDSLGFSRLLVEGLHTSFWLASFTTLCFSILIVPFYAMLFQHGKITFHDTINNGIAICMYATGIILASSNKVLVNTLYSLNATRQIIYNAIIYLLLNTILNILLVPKFGMIGMGFSFGIVTSLDFWLNYLTIIYYFHKAGYQGSPYLSGGNYFTAKILLLNIAGFVICLFGVWLIENIWINLPLNFLGSLLIVLVGGCVLTTIFLLALLKWGPSHLKGNAYKLINKIVTARP
jgi:putative peptidoglycan lipid II flippase